MTSITARTGLTSAEVAQRTTDGLVNTITETTSRTVGEIVRANVFTRFNAILGSLFVVVLVFGSWQDGLFGGIVIVNALIGIVQELRAKRALDGLILLNAPRAHVVRDGSSHDIAIAEVVIDELIELRPGDQVPADGTVSVSEQLEIDESLLTGESDPVAKAVGDEVLSGGIVVGGRGWFQATRIGEAAYARSLTNDARRFTQTRSELSGGINRLLGYISWALIVVGPILLWSQLRSGESTRNAVTATVAGVVGMVPEGLVLLTSMAFLLAALNVARRNVLVQELPAVEGLARVDVVCLDKTGTLTENRLDFERIETLDPSTPRTEQLADALGALTVGATGNATTKALAAHFNAPTAASDGSADPWAPRSSVAFSSARKWSSSTFADRGTWVLGAPEIVLASTDHHGVVSHAGEIAATGQRVLVAAHSESPADNDTLPDGLTPVALVMFDERLRPDAAETLAYFIEQGVAIKVISGDNPRTVGAVARRVGLPGADQIVDARHLPTEPGPLADAIEAGTVFGRVTPHQKRAMVGALQSRGHVVAMTGDGVNDALALKDADIGVAMGSGAPATRAVAQLVALDDRFASLPYVVAEGRRVMANIERVATLFLIKNVYSTVLALAVALTRIPFPFLPRHLTLISAVTIGMPGLVLAVGANTKRYEPGFLRRVLRLSVPIGVLSAIVVVVAYGIARAENVPGNEARTAATIAIVVIGLFVLTLLTRPMTGSRLALVIAMAALFALALSIPGTRNFFALTGPAWLVGEAIAVGGVGGVLMLAAARIVERHR